MNLEAKCKTTAMGIMPYNDVDRALSLALSLDIPFWPQLPSRSFYQNSYAQAAYGFPGVTIDIPNEKINFSIARFEKEIWEYSQKLEEDKIFSLSGQYATAYRRFLRKGLGHCPAIRGQVAGPVSLGFNILDEERKPVIYNDEVRALLFDFIQHKANVQYRQLRQKNERAFVWLDEPMLLYIFSGLFGYDDYRARNDYQTLLRGLEGPKALHLCANVNLPYLLGLGVELLSFDAYQIGSMPQGYASAVAQFLKEGGIISWGIVPAEPRFLNKETGETLLQQLLSYWEVIARNDISLRQVAEQALIAPARCFMKPIELGQAAGNPGQATIEEALNLAFLYLKEISGRLKDQFSF